jgi:hypothetical protein
LRKKPPAGKPLKAAPRAKSGSDQALAEVLKSLDEATLARVRESLRADLDFDDDQFDEDDPVEMFDAFLDKLAQFADEAPDEDGEDSLDDMMLALTQLSIDDNGGDPQARAARAAIYEKLEEALAAERLDAPGLVLVAKILNDSGWRVPESLKASVIETLESAGPPAEGVGASDIKSSLAEIAEGAEGDAFAAYDALNSVLAAFPSEAAARMVGALGEERAPLVLHTLAGFAMHRDGAIANAAITELKRTASAGRVESALVERLVRMRPWLPADRQGLLDDAIRALRAQAHPPLEIERPKAAKCFVLACDGSGANGALASLKASDGWRFVAALARPSGVEEVLSLEGVPKAQVDATVRDMRANVMAAQTDVAGVSKYLQFALGENVVSKTPPPFRLIAFVENLGLGPVAPRVLSPSDLIEAVLDGLPAYEKDAAAVARAHDAAAGGALDSQWFEAGESVERLLGPIRGVKARAKTVLSVYLPERRDFWLRACALTAFVLNMDRKTYGALGKSLALVGRELASGTPMEKIPLMRQIAEITVRAYQSRF